MVRPAIALFALHLLGCAWMRENAVRVTALDPQPQIELQRSKARLAIDLEQLPDSFVIPQQNGIVSVPVEQWRETIGAGFVNGLAPFFQRPTDRADYVLHFLKADLDYADVQLPTDEAPAVHARVSYRVEVTYRTGEIVQRLDSEAWSKLAWVETGGSQATAAEAVALMYQQIAERGMRSLPKILPVLDLAPPKAQKPKPPPEAAPAEAGSALEPR